MPEQGADNRGCSCPFSHPLYSRITVTWTIIVGAVLKPRACNTAQCIQSEACTQSIMIDQLQMPFASAASYQNNFGYCMTVCLRFLLWISSRVFFLNCPSHLDTWKQRTWNTTAYKEIKCQNHETTDATFLFYFAFFYLFSFIDIRVGPSVFYLTCTCVLL